MNASRRGFLLRATGLGTAGLGVSLLNVGDVQASDYKALVVVFLAGGSDGNNMLVPTNAAYNDYARARASIAHPRDSLVALSGRHVDHTFGLSPALAPLAGLFEQKRLAIVTNVGALIEPGTIADYRAGRMKLPPFLGSHFEQEQWIQGWGGNEDLSGWGGRAIDAFPANMRSRQPLVALSGDATVVRARETLMSRSSGASANIGRANLDDAQNSGTRTLEWAARLQSDNAYEAEVAASLRRTYLDTIEFSRSQRYGAEPAGNFPQVPFGAIGHDLRFVARHMAYSRDLGARRQVYLVHDGGYDTHSDQLSTSTGQPGQEMRLNAVSASLKAFDDSVRAQGMDGQVLTVVISEFGRTLDPTSGRGTDHAWGNHWFAIGGAVRGGMVYGPSFPVLQVGGPDDTTSGHPRGYWLPRYSSDQFASDALRWMGLSAAQALAVMPNLANFPQPTVGYI
jgi:uncharacterized protein (DUF1501 family)